MPKVFFFSDEGVFTRGSQKDALKESVMAEMFNMYSHGKRGHTHVKVCVDYAPRPQDCLNRLLKRRRFDRNFRADREEPKDE